MVEFKIGYRKKIVWSEKQQQQPERRRHYRRPSCYKPKDREREKKR